MRFSLIALILSFCLLTINAQKTDSTRTRATISGSFSLNSNGIASIPAFSLGKPALIGSFTVQKRRFSYDPVIAYGLNMRPWVIDNWVHYRLIYRPKFEIRTGVDFSNFFSTYDAGEYNIHQGQQYITFEIASIFKFSPESTLSLMYWSDNGQDRGTITGSFYNVMYDRTGIRLGRKVLLAASVQLFCIEYTGKNDGFFIAPRVGASVVNVPFQLFFQVTQGIVSNVKPFPGFTCNVGAAYLF
jgi:hypothetical protein